MFKMTLQFNTQHYSIKTRAKFLCALSCDRYRECGVLMYIVKMALNCTISIYSTFVP